MRTKKSYVDCGTKGAIKRWSKSMYAERFWKNVQVSECLGECWEWKNKTGNAGYGQVKFFGKFTGAHRVAYMLSKGNIPDGFLICHSCDNKKCCNPFHLWIGSPQDNRLDAFIKHIPNSSVKLSFESAEEIRKIASDGVSQGELAKKFGVSNSHISNIVNNRSWVM